MKRLILAGALLLVPQVAFAEGATQDSDARFQEGVILLKAGNSAAAKEKFLQSLALYRGAPVLLNLALSEASEHPDVALGYLREWMAHPAAPAAKVESARREILPVLEAKTGRMSVDAAPGELVTIDGKSVGKAPLKLAVDVMPGRHTAACGTRTVTIDVPAGGQVAVVLKDEAVTPPPLKTEHGDWLVPGALAGIGLIGVAVGAVGSGLASGSNAEAKDLSARVPCGRDIVSPECRSLGEATDRTGLQSSVALTGWVVGGGFLAAAVVSALVLKPWKERPVAQVRLVPAPAGFLLTGTF